MKKFRQKRTKAPEFTLVVLKEKRNNFFRLKYFVRTVLTKVQATYLSPERATTIAFNDDVSRKKARKGEKKQEASSVAFVRFPHTLLCYKTVLYISYIVLESLREVLENLEKYLS
jgi:hypothetical protein